MIVNMLKVYVVSAANDRDTLMGSLGELGVLHLTPVDRDKAVADEKTLASIDTAAKAVQILSDLEPAGRKPKISAEQAAEESVGIRRRSTEAANRLATLHRQIERLAMWGDVRLEQFEQLRRSGVDVQFFSVPQKNAPDVQAEFVQILGDLRGKRTLVAVIDRGGEVSLPEQADPVSLPKRDRPSIRKEAAEIDAALKADSERLAELAHMVDEIKAWQTRLQHHADYTIATKGAVSGEHLFAVQGWAPAEKAESLAADLAAAGIEAAAQTFEPAEDDTPPTLIRYPRWTLPIKGLFDLLGTVAGFREFDVSVPFMIALPIFAAMLIGDGGYGVILLLGPLLFHKRAAKALGAEFTRLITVIGAVGLIWGALTGTFFGVVLYRPVIPVDMSERSRTLIMQISFIMGAIHLSAAQLWRALVLWPSLKVLGRIGWAIFIWGMLGVVRHYVMGAPSPFTLESPWSYLLIAGGALAIVFESPSRNPLKMLALGVANFPLSVLSAFADVISYVRLMAVGLASGVLASSFNELALSTGSWLAAIPVLVFGHGLNLGLALIAIFAHGVRLNMLEFSNNLGMEWTGYQYCPFTQPASKEIVR